MAELLKTKTKAMNESKFETAFIFDFQCQNRAPEVPQLCMSQLIELYTKQDEFFYI